MKHNDGACAACRAELRLQNGNASQDGGSFVLHTLAAAALATSLSILGTAGDLGPFAPMLIALGFYLALFGLVIYVGLAARAVLRAAARRRDGRAAQRAPASSSVAVTQILSREAP